MLPLLESPVSRTLTLALARLSTMSRPDVSAGESLFCYSINIASAAARARHENLRRLEWTIGAGAAIAMFLCIVFHVPVGLACFAVRAVTLFVVLPFTVRRCLFIKALNCSTVLSFRNHAELEIYAARLWRRHGGPLDDSDLNALMNKPWPTLDA